MEQQSQARMIRVGIVPAMLGMEGDTPIVVEIPSTTPPEQIQEVAMAQARASKPQSVTLGQNQLGLSAGSNQMGITLPPMSGGDASAALKAFPQAVGLGASFHPAARTAKMAFSIPFATEMGTQMLSGDELDPVSAAGQGSLGFLSHGIGQGMSKVARGGVSTVRRALNLRPPFDNRTSEIVLPDKAISEGASMTMKGVDTVRRKAHQTGQGSLEDLAEVLESARHDAAVSPNIQGVGLVGLLSHLINPPRQLKVGQAMAKAGNVDPQAHQGGDIIARLVSMIAAGMRGVESEPQTKRRQP